MKQINRARTLDLTANLWFTCPMFDPVLNERREDFATDEEHVAYWLQYCKDAPQRAADRAEAKKLAMRGLNDEMRARRL